MQRIRALIAETGETGFHLVDEAAPPAAHARAREAPHRREAQHHLVGQHPLREDLHARALPPARRSRLRGRERRARGGVGPAARAHEERRHRRAGGARDARLHRCRHHGARLPDVRLPDRDRAGHDRRARARAPAVRGGLHPVGLLASLRGDGAFAHRPASRALRHHAAAAARTSRLRTTTSSSTTPPARITTISARGLRKALYNYMHGIGLDADVREWFEPRAGARRGARQRRRRGTSSPPCRHHGAAGPDRALLAEPCVDLRAAC